MALMMTVPQTTDDEIGRFPFDPVPLAMFSISYLEIPLVVVFVGINLGYRFHNC